ncbi:hypothetical protein J1614_005062 [Plenodomus biglobosus]|nr:hypothetical protein J1614_005062 [Plenodomus biglobosus]
MLLSREVGVPFSTLQPAVMAKPASMHGLAREPSKGGQWQMIGHPIEDCRDNDGTSVRSALPLPAQPEFHRGSLAKAHCAHSRAWLHEQLS